MSVERRPEIKKQGRSLEDFKEFVPSVNNSDLIDNSGLPCKPSCIQCHQCSCRGCKPCRPGNESDIRVDKIDNSGNLKNKSNK